MPKFEVVIFNQEVRDCVKMQEKHEGFEDEWADPHYIEVSAPDEDAARAKINRQYPPGNGFVISDISPVTENTF
ncbi:MAG: hypothetical protein ACTSV1_06380 [Alphaproteobacteria bacterium]